MMTILNTLHSTASLCEPLSGLMVDGGHHGRPATGGRGSAAATRRFHTMGSLSFNLGTKGHVYE